MSRMLRWSESASRVELDQQAREARLQLEQARRLFADERPVAPSRVEMILRLFGGGMFGRRQADCRAAVEPSAERSPRSVPTNPEIPITGWGMRPPGCTGSDAAWPVEDTRRSLAIASVICPLTPGTGGPPAPSNLRPLRLRAYY